MTAMSTDEEIFMDSWAFLALANRRDIHHRQAEEFFGEIKAKSYLIVTSDYILDEVITSLFKKVNFEGAQKFVEAILSDIKTGQIILELIDVDRFNYAWLLRSIYRDKPDISFTDLTSFVLMRDLDISRVFTGDRHFAMVNLGFRILPDVKFINSPFHSSTITDTVQHLSLSENTISRQVARLAEIGALEVLPRGKTKEVQISLTSRLLL